jgi:hypothetical protein
MQKTFNPSTSIALDSIRVAPISFTVAYPRVGRTKVVHAFGLRWKVSDELRAVEEGCGMDLAAFNSDPSWTLTMPARYVVASDGMIDGYYRRSLGWPAVAGSRSLHRDPNPAHTRDDRG